MTTLEKTSGGGRAVRSELRNTMNFHVGDFIGVNNKNWDLFGHSHARDVIVDFGGHRTETVDDHLNEMRQLLVQYPDMLVVRHDPKVAEGDWTATVAYITGWGPGQVKFVTVAKWRDDKVVEEYLFTRELNEDETTAAESGESTITMTTPDDEELWPRAGLEPGWTCKVYGSGPGTKAAVFTRRKGDQIVERLALAEV